MDESPDIILGRLEELRRWQEEQQQILLQKQVSQRELLNMEQQKLYEMFGLSINSSAASTTSAAATMGAENVSGSTLSHLTINDEDLGDGIELIGSDSDDNDRQQLRKNSDKSLEEFKRFSDNLQDKCAEENVEQKPKRPFLRRGEGFKVNPDQFRLNNLPKYKFANAHKTSKFLQNKEVVEPKAKPIVKKRQNPKKKFVGNLCLKKKDGETSKPATQQPVQTQRPIEAEQMLDAWIQDSNDNRVSLSRTLESEESTITNATPITWATVLDPTNIKPISMANVRPNDLSFQDSTTQSERNFRHQQEIEELNVFELLEKNLDRTDNLVAETREIQQPTDPLADANTMGKRNFIKPFPFDVQQNIRIDTDSDSDDESGGTDRGRVRFAENVIVNELESESDTIQSTDMEYIDLSKTSTPNTKAFEEFKMNLFRNNQSDVSQQESTLLNDYSVGSDKLKDFQEKSELLKDKFAELNAEVDLFRQQNAQLTKMRQDHELKKIELAEERQQIEDNLNDERIKIEVYLHDERMKLEDERQKLDKRAKELKTPNRKEREEVVKLKEQIAELKSELSLKEQKHVSAQARLRAQIRNMEKDLKSYSMDIENLQKENKKLESENVRLRRQQNNKMLNEINKNIAKLAPSTGADINVAKREGQQGILKRGVSLNKSSSVSKVNFQSNPRTRSKSVPNLMDQQSSDSEESCDESDEREQEEVSIPKQRSSFFVRDVNPKTPPSVQSGAVIEPPVTQAPLQNYKREIQNADGSKDIWYPNGNLKKISSDLMTIRMLYYNKDIKETNIGEGTVKYYYAETNTWHTTYLDGLEILEFPNGQIEHRYKDGTIEVHFPGGAIRKANPNNMEVSEEWKYTDGSTLVQRRDGDKLLTLPNGQREIHTKLHKRREYPDGTVKIVFPDGSQETRYSNGRVRLKDSSGKLVMDSDSMFTEQN